MERIVIEVNKATAKKWRSTKAPKRKKLVSILANALNEQDDFSKVQKGKVNVNSEARLSESSLAKEWLSPEDSRWDELLK
ncbi:MAG: hypothetical protein K2U26_14930 [Cyclobacteriaceae bacterium]|nr:hypothetical protein [Cyclobacteriaceae bacterium]